MKFDFAALHSAAKTAGAVVKDHGDGHWHIVGDYLVNFYPYAAKGASYYIAGTAKGRRFNGGVGDLVQLAFEPPAQTKEAQRKARYGNQKRRLLRENAVCSYCGIPLSLETARLDHRIPLSKGGSNGYDNLCLACEKCDTEKGNKMPHENKPDGKGAVDSKPAATPDPKTSAPVVPHPAGGSIPVVQVAAEDVLPEEMSPVATPPANFLIDDMTEFTVVGFWTESNQPFTHPVRARSVENAIERARSELTDTEQTNTSIVDVLCLVDGEIRSMLGNKQVIDWPVGTARVCGRIVDSVMVRYGLTGDRKLDDLLARIKQAVVDLVTFFASALDDSERIQSLWEDYIKPPSSGPDD